MTIKQYNFCIAESTTYDDRDAYISDLSLSSIWGDPDGADVPSSRIDDLSGIWDAARRSIKGIATASGLSCRELAERFGIPYRTVEDWSAGARECNLYIRLMMQECLGLLAVQIS